MSLTESGRNGRLRKSRADSRSCNGVSAASPKAGQLPTQCDGKKIQKVTEVVTGTESVVRAVSFLHSKLSQMT
jgi:hypothetical protein